MKQIFPSLMSPIKVRNMVIKNRMMSTTSIPHFISGPEGHPNDHMIEHLAKRAFNGAGVVTISHTYSSKGPFDPNAMMPPPMEGEDPLPVGGDPPHFPEWDVWSPKNQNYMIMLNDAIHYYGSKSCFDIALEYEMDWDVTGNEAMGVKEFTREKIEEYISLILEQCELCPALGFDMISLHVAYRDTFLSRFLSPATNKRTDEWGGSLENRAKVPLMVFRHIKEKMGQNFVTSAAISCTDKDDGYTFEEFCEFAKMADGLIDIMQVRLGDANDSHPTGYLAPNPTLKYAEQLKKLNLKYTKIMPVGGYQDPAMMDEAIRTGKADMFAASRMWIADPHWGEKIAAGHPEDITPCLLCNRCHVISNNTPYLSMCSVNPEFGIQHVLHNAVRPVTRKKKVAVVGGGAAGLRAAIYLNDRGHDVTVYEKSGVLGGALNAAGAPEFKWPVKRYLNWLIAQIEKRPIRVLMNTAATPEMIRDYGYDAVIAAIGGQPSVPPIPGVNGENVITSVDALNNPEKVKGKVVVIGGGGIGTETGIYFGRNGHRTTILEMLPILAAEDMVPHIGEVIQNAVKDTELLDSHCSVRVTEIKPDRVCYADKDGSMQEVLCDTVIISTGTKPKQDEGMGFWGIVPESYVIGDCNKVGNLMFANRAAFAAANCI